MVLHKFMKGLVLQDHNSMSCYCYQILLRVCVDYSIYMSLHEKKQQAKQPIDYCSCQMVGSYVISHRTKGPIM